MESVKANSKSLSEMNRNLSEISMDLKSAIHKAYKQN